MRRPQRASDMASYPCRAFLASGGPVAQIATIRRELADEEHRVSSERFNWTLALYSAIMQSS
jgi:chromate transport protein ChrA